jgi:hypothetical protein
MSVTLWSHSSQRESRPRPRVPRPFWVLIGIALALGVSLELRAALESPGQTIRGELEAAAVDLQSAPMEHSERALAQLRRNFHERDVTIDATQWPLVSVTLHGVDASTCRDAVDKARRIEGLVVVALERYGAVDECGNTNDMTWRILP